MQATHAKMALHRHSRLSDGMKRRKFCQIGTRAGTWSVEKSIIPAKFLADLEFIDLQGLAKEIM